MQMQNLICTHPSATCVNQASEVTGGGVGGGAPCMTGVPATLLNNRTSVCAIVEIIPIPTGGCPSNTVAAHITTIGVDACVTVIST